MPAPIWRRSIRRAPNPSRWPGCQGPAGAGFRAFNAGFRDGIQDSAVVWSPDQTRRCRQRVQGAPGRDLLQTHWDLDYLAGTAVMAEPRCRCCAQASYWDKGQAVSVYMTPGVYQRRPSRSTPPAAPGGTDRAHHHRHRRAPAGEKRSSTPTSIRSAKVYTPENIGTLDRSTVLAPDGFSPVFKFGSKPATAPFALDHADARDFTDCRSAGAAGGQPVKALRQQPGAGRRQPRRYIPAKCVLFSGTARASRR